MQISWYSRPVPLGDGKQAWEGIHARSSTRSSLQYLDEFILLQVLEDLCAADLRDPYLLVKLGRTEDRRPEERINRGDRVLRLDHLWHRLLHLVVKIDDCLRFLAVRPGPPLDDVEEERRGDSTDRRIRRLSRPL